MELAAHQHDEPAPRPLAKRLPHAPRKNYQARSVEHAQNGPYDELGMLEAEYGDGALGDAGQDQRANEGPGDGAREGEVVIVIHEARIDVGRGGAIDQNVVGCLYGEGLLDLCVRGEDEVGEDCQGDEVFCDG